MHAPLFCALTPKGYFRLSVPINESQTAEKTPAKLKEGYFVIPVIGDELYHALTLYYEQTSLKVNASPFFMISEGEERTKQILSEHAAAYLTTMGLVSLTNKAGYRVCRVDRQEMASKVYFPRFVDSAFN